jgi:DNA-binding transcriptional MerR regulator
MAEGINASGGPGVDKPIYTLSVASEILETHPRTLMMYESVGLVRPHRTATNRRRYSQRDLATLQAIQAFTRRHGVNLAGVRLLLKLLVLLRDNNVSPPSELGSIDVSLVNAA